MPRRLGLARLGARAQQVVAHVVVALLELLHRLWCGAPEAVVDHGPAQVEAAAQVEELVAFRLVPCRVHLVRGRVKVGVRVGVSVG
eukprot:scaffold114593_cov57-Phaeocystis_antarctica.AAC.2